jgi:hypothetical protein
MAEKENEFEEFEGKNPLLELDLSRITLLEATKYDEEFKDYEKCVRSLLILNEMIYGEKEILEGFKESGFQINTIDEVLYSFPYVVPAGAIMNDEGEAVGGLFINLAHRYFVKPADSNYNALFAYNLRQLDIFRIDRTLDYHLVNYYQNNLLDFSRFLSLCMRKYGNTLLLEETLESVKEWITYRENKQKEALQKDESQSAENQDTKNKRVKVKREAGDKRTVLNQEQTVLLMYYLQQEKIILKDEYLTDMDAGKAFEILTGYSQHTLRQNLGKYFLFQNKENLKALDNTLTKLKIRIDQALKEK